MRLAASASDGACQKALMLRATSPLARRSIHAL
jgi:hypothetical protein